jgi:ubiquinone/menaquinone biosynthesis C-methylase UbiE
MTKRKQAPNSGYLHGYDPKEQERLIHQARFLEEHVFESVDFKGCKHIIEIGSGVGAQTKILRERFPKIHISCVDASNDQLKTAQRHLNQDIKKGIVSLTQAYAQELPFSKNTFDGAFVTWFLEHVSDPVAVLKEAKRVLQKGAVIHINEVLNNSFFVDPYSPATQQYWFVFNDHQWSLKGDPYVGAKLGNYLMAAGFKNIETQFSYWHLDNREPKIRAQFLEYWTNLLISGAPELVRSGKVSKELVKKMATELRSLKKHKDSVIFTGFMKAKAVV